MHHYSDAVLIAVMVLTSHIFSLLHHGVAATLSSLRSARSCLASLANDNVIGATSCVAYCVVNLVLNVLNGWIFLRSPFRFPLSLTVLHMVVGYFITAGLFRARGKACEVFVQQKIPPSGEFTRRLVLLGALSGINIALNNVSLLYINVALNQIVKAFNPVLIAISDVLIRGHMYKCRVWVGFLCITFGVMCTVFNNPQFHINGFVFCTGSSVAAAIQTTLAEHVMTDDVKLDANNFMYYTSLWSALCILPVAIVFDSDVFFMQMFANTHWFIFMIFITSFLAFLNNITLLLCIKFTSGAYSGVVGNVKIVMIVLVQQVLWPEDARQLHAIHWFGMALTIASFAVLSFIKYRPITKEEKESIEKKDDKEVERIDVLQDDGEEEAKL